MTRSRRTLWDGLTAGLIGYAAVAVFYAMFDVLAARGTLFTLDLLGKATFRGVRDPALLLLPQEPDLIAMLAYNFLHLGVALAVGLFVAWLLGRVEVRPAIGQAVFVLLLAGYLVTIAVVGALGRQFLSLLPWWTIVASNTLAAGLAGAYLLKVHPGLWDRVKRAN